MNRTRLSPIGPLILRVGAGAVFVGSGLQKLLGIGGVPALPARPHSFALSISLLLFHWPSSSHLLSSSEDFSSSLAD
jgi:uncharacterized membrane protein YphA (DoxX/SURF4 family)